MKKGILFLSLLISPLAFSGPIYQCEGTNGNKAYQDRPCKGEITYVPNIQEGSESRQLKSQSTNATYTIAPEEKKALELATNEFMHEMMEGMMKKGSVNKKDFAKACFYKNEEIATNQTLTIEGVLMHCSRSNRTGKTLNLLVPMRWVEFCDSHGYKIDECPDPLKKKPA